MKNEAKVIVPLTNGAVLVRRSITLGMGHVAEVTIAYDGPSEPCPRSGCEWPPQTDWPASRVTLLMPRQQTGDGSIHADMHGAGRVLGEDVTTSWGVSISGTALVSRTQRNVGASLRAVAAEQLRRVLAELRPVQAHLKARAARIAARETTLLAGQDMAPLKNQ